MKYQLLFLLLIAFGVLHAQPVIGPDDMPSAGQSYQLIQSSGVDVEDPGPVSGADLIWDYSDLPEINIQNNDYVAVSEAPVLYQFFFNNPFSPSFSNHAQPVSPGDFELPIPITDIYNFYRADDEGYFDCGFAASLSGFPVSGARNPTDRILKFPLEYGMEADTNDTFFNLNIPELANIKSYRIRTNSTDGWGTVITPGGSFEALRVRSVVNGVDSVYSESFGINQVINQPETIEYRWIAAGQGLPVLQINVVDGAVTQVTYRGLETTSVDLHTAMNEVKAFPNPASDVVTVNLPSGEMAQSAVLVDLAGHQFFPEFEHNTDIVRLNVHHFAPGLYRLVIRGKEGLFESGVLIAR